DPRGVVGLLDSGAAGDEGRPDDWAALRMSPTQQCRSFVDLCMGDYRKSSATIVRRSRRYRFAPTSVGGVHAVCSNTAAFAMTRIPCGDTRTNANWPSSSSRINLPSAYTKLAFGKARSCQTTSPVLTFTAVSSPGLDPKTRSPRRMIVL